MLKSDLHTFHIPVMGLGYTIDTPLKVARFGISSVVSIIEDELVEQMRKFYSEKSGEKYIPVNKENINHRSLRIKEYLNLLGRIVSGQMKKLRSEPFEKGREIVKYFEMLPDNSSLKRKYFEMISLGEGSEKQILQNQLRESIFAGSIDVNIMTKCDKTNYFEDGKPLSAEYSDAMAALRGFALSDLSSSVIFSAGLNPRLYTYCESFPDFFPAENGTPRKKIILKVSDFRSAMIQGKFFAKKGLLISEFRIESGLNCGGHAFATEGLLLGPILQEFCDKKDNLFTELFTMSNLALKQKGFENLYVEPKIKVTVQGGIGTANEDKFLFNYYKVDGTGWGSPFLLVPEATNVDSETLVELSMAKKEDFYLSNASPLGIPFHNFRKSSSSQKNRERIERKRPGSPCYKKFLSFNIEFTSTPICTASREYQNLKIKELEGKHLPSGSVEKEFNSIVEKECLCEGLGAGVLLKNDLPISHNLNSVAICPGPNLAYFSGIFSLEDMVHHIYGRKNILNLLKRPNMFINELVLYIDYFKKEIEKNFIGISEKQSKSFAEFKNNLLEGIKHYRSLIPNMNEEIENYKNNFLSDLFYFETLIHKIHIPPPSILVK